MKTIISVLSFLLVSQVSWAQVNSASAGSGYYASVRMLPAGENPFNVELQSASPQGIFQKCIVVLMERRSTLIQGVEVNGDRVEFGYSNPAYGQKVCREVAKRAISQSGGGIATSFRSVGSFIYQISNNPTLFNYKGNSPQEIAFQCLKEHSSDPLGPLVRKIDVNGLPTSGGMSLRDACAYIGQQAMSWIEE